MFIASEKVSEIQDEAIGQLISYYNGGAVACMISLGHRLKLFDTLAEFQCCTVAQFADRAGIAPRYAREWLSVMVTARLVELSSDESYFRLPELQRALLTSEAVPNNLAVLGQFVPLIGQTEDKLMACFKSGEGLDYCEYPHFHRVMSEDSYQTVVDGIEEQILPLMPGINEKLKQGIRVLDAGCGAGLALLKLAALYPNSTFVGYDLCPDAFRESQLKAKQQGLDNLSFHEKDLTNLTDVNCYDLVFTFDAVHDQAAPQLFLDNLCSALKQDGTYLMQDIGGSSSLKNNLQNDLAPLLYTMSTAHCTPVSLAQGGPGLGTMWGTELATSMLQQAGFTQIHMQRLDHDPINVYAVCSKS